MQIDPGKVAATVVPSGLQVNSLNSKAIVGGVTNVDKMQIDPGTIVVPTSGLQMKDLNETQIGPGMVAPLATPTAPCGLEVSSLNLSTTEIS